MNLQRMGGIASLVEALIFVIGFSVMITLLMPAGYGRLDVDPVEHVTFLVEHQHLMYAWNLIIYVTFGIFLVVLALALHERLKGSSSAIARTATALGLIWAGLVIASGMVANMGAGTVIDIYGRDPDQAGLVWLSLSFVVNGLGGGNEIVGGLWVVLLSWTALQAHQLPRALNYLGLVSGSAGVATAIPILGELGAIFGLGLIVWFTWLGVVLIRGRERG